MLELCADEMNEAVHEAEVVHRRWRKTLDTYFNCGDGRSCGRRTAWSSATWPA